MVCLSPVEEDCTNKDVTRRRRQETMIMTQPQRRPETPRHKRAVAVHNKHKMTSND